MSFWTLQISLWQGGGLGEPYILGEYVPSSLSATPLSTFIGQHNNHFTEDVKNSILNSLQLHKVTFIFADDNIERISLHPLHLSPNKLLFLFCVCGNWLLWNDHLKQQFVFFWGKYSMPLLFKSSEIHDYISSKIHYFGWIEVHFKYRGRRSNNSNVFLCHFYLAIKALVLL